MSRSRWFRKSVCSCKLYFFNDAGAAWIPSLDNGRNRPACSKNRSYFCANEFMHFQERERERDVGVGSKVSFNLSPYCEYSCSPWWHNSPVEWTWKPYSRKCLFSRGSVTSEGELGKTSSILTSNSRNSSAKPSIWYNYFAAFLPLQRSYYLRNFWSLPWKLYSTKQKALSHDGGCFSILRKIPLFL